MIIDGADRLGGNHIWSFFASDVAEEDRWLVEPLISATWPDHEVAFPKRRRRIDGTYHSIRSERLDAVVRERLRGDQIRLGTQILSVEADGVVLADGERIAGSVIDGRGAADMSMLDLGWQKFVGLDFRFAEPHGVARPMIMDATVAQLDGYRFIYLLPFSDTELLIEDTYYSDGPDLDVPDLRARILAHVETLGLPRGEVVREETGVLPVAIGGDVRALLDLDGGAAKIGMRGGFFHPTTGYSLPDAVRSASLLARQSDWSGEALRRLFRGEALRTWRRRGFYRMLNTMLFRAAEPPERYKVLQRFYALSPALIGRFYAGRSTFADKARILAGKPPVPIFRALKALSARKRK